jgi:hypothetical protein
MNRTRYPLAIPSFTLFFFALTLCNRVESGQPDYLETVRAYADTMVERGRDRYGSASSPLFATTLDRGSVTIPEGRELESLLNIPQEDWGIRPHDRMLTGANPMHDQNLYQVLYGLSEVTGEPHYAEEADKTLRWFFGNCQSATTGLMAWGEHIGWDFNTETLIEKGAGTTHEYFRPWVLWDRSYDLAPDACAAFARGVWEHQIGDPESGNFSRHARYDQHGPGTDSEYPRHGGFYIDTWAHAYSHKKDPVFLKAIDTLLGYFDRRRHPTSDAIPSESDKRSEGKTVWPPSNLSLAIDLWNGSELVPNDLAERMRQSARRTDTVFLRMKHDVSPTGGGFLKYVDAETLETKDWDHRQGRTRMWATGYGDSTDADIANLCLLRYEQVGLEGYRDLAVSAANRYLESEPDIAFPVYPGTLGGAIILQLRTYRLTGDALYLERANHFAQRSLRIFFTNDSPLPRASSRHEHYEAITRADTLMMAFLGLWTLQNRPDLDLSQVYCDR